MKHLEKLSAVRSEIIYDIQTIVRTEGPIDISDARFDFPLLIDTGDPIAPQFNWIVRAKQLTEDGLVCDLSFLLGEGPSEVDEVFPYSVLYTDILFAVHGIYESMVDIQGMA